MDNDSHYREDTPPVLWPGIRPASPDISSLLLEDSHDVRTILGLAATFGIRVLAVSDTDCHHSNFGTDPLIIWDCLPSLTQVAPLSLPDRYESVTTQHLVRSELFWAAEKQPVATILRLHNGHASVIRLPAEVQGRELDNDRRIGSEGGLHGVRHVETSLLNTFRRGRPSKAGTPLTLPQSPNPQSHKTQQNLPECGTQII